MKTFPSERSSWIDAGTGLAVTAWTRHASNHPYFTHPGWFDGGRKMLFASDRDGRTGLAVLDLEDGTQRTLCDLPEGSVANAFQMSVDPATGRVVAQIDGHFDLIDGFTGERQRLFTMGPEWDGIIPSFTADGKKVCFGLTAASSLPFTERFEARPLSRILVHDLARGTTETVHERQLRMGHVNASPAVPHLLTFCHEGPWTRVEHRVWGCDLRDGRVWRIRPLPGPPACIGHEFWLGDGRRIGYHGFDMHTRPVLGIADAEGDGFVEHPISVKTKHAHILDGSLIVGDGTEALPWVLAWRLTDARIEGPWKLCHHGGGWSEQRRHIHPRIGPDGRTVWFTSDWSGEPRIYSVGIPDALDSLPRVSAR